MATKQEVQVVGGLVAEKFSDYQIKPQSKSPNGLHFVLKKNGEKKHLKVIDSSSLDDEGIDEIELLEEISSPNVISLEEHGELNDKFTYLMFPHIDGKTLDKLKTDTGWLSEQLVKLAFDVANAVKDMAAAGIVHRDIKPKNIIREEASGNYIVLDLGIGYFVDQADRDNTKAKGSRNYSSPEQFKSIESDDDDISFASDHFSLGMILYWLASNKHPFEDFNAEKYSTIGEAICKMPAQAISVLRTDLDGDLMNVMMRLLQKSPSKRYWSPEGLQKTLDGQVEDNVQTLEFYITEPKSTEFIEDYLAGISDSDKPNGVLLPINASDDRIKRVVQKGLNILLDPETFKLPFPKASQTNMRKKLKLPSGKFTTAKLNDDKFLKKLVEKTVTAQSKCVAVILPYFAITTLDDGLVEINRKVEEIYFKHVHKDTENRKIYAGVMLPHSLIVNAKSRTKLMDRLMKTSKVDGHYVLFENPDLDDYDYLDGVSDILSMLKSKGKVIVGRADLAFIPILKHGIIVTSPDKSQRSYSFKNKLISPKIQDGSTAEETWRLRYYVEPLFNFLEEKTTLESLASLGFESDLGCDCPYCENAQPFDPATDKSHDDSRRHFYYRIARMRNRLSGMKESDFRTAFVGLLEEAARIAEEISLKTAGSERYSRHERLIEIV